MFILDWEIAEDLKYLKMDLSINCWMLAAAIGTIDKLWVIFVDNIYLQDQYNLP